MLEFSRSKVIGNYTKEIPVTENDIESVIVGAFEGGSNYWVGLDNTKPEFKDKPKDEPLSTWVTKLLIDGKTVYLFDREMPSDKFELTLQKVINGLALNALKRPKDCDLEQGDAITYDCILQFALFGKIVFG